MFVYPRIVNRLTQTCIVLCFLLTACQGEAPSTETVGDQLTSRVSTPKVETPRLESDGTVVHQRPHLMDAMGRYVQIRGINVSGSHKAPPSEVHLEVVMPPEGTPEGERHRPSRYPLTDLERPECLDAMPIPADCLEQGPDGRPCTETDTCTINYIASPFPMDESDKWFGQMAGLGFNSVRLITNWESIQPYRPGSAKCQESDRYTDECYDLEYLAYYEELIVKAKAHGIYVLVDMHQDIFSRHVMTYYNESPTYVDGGEEKEAIPGTLDHLILSLFPPTQTGFADMVRLDGWYKQPCPRRRWALSIGGCFVGLGT